MTNLILAPLRGVTVRCFRETFAAEIAAAGFTEAVTPFISAMPGIDPLKDRELRGGAAESGIKATPQFIGKDPAALRQCLKAVKGAGYLAAGFDYLYDKVGMYDYLRGITSKNWPADGITSQWMRHGEARLKHMLYFLENHDEQRLASGFFCGDGRCAEPAMIVAATLNQCPVMIYSGQELGERGMDMEGFSGIDGRTTIFDYWGVKSMQAWTNKGKFDGAKLSADQQELRDFYQRLLTIARDDKAVQKGQMYDLEYAQGEGFDKREQFAFLRHTKGETLLVVVNFHDREQHIKVHLPNDAFVYLGLEGKATATATDLLTNTKTQLSFVPDGDVELTLNAWKGVILRIK